MKLTIDKSQCFAASDSLCQLLNDELARVSVPDANTGGIIFNFRDVDYPSDGGGFHPVEIRVVKHLMQGKRFGGSSTSPILATRNFLTLNW